MWGTTWTPDCREEPRKVKSRKRSHGKVMTSARDRVLCFQRERLRSCFGCACRASSEKDGSRSRFHGSLRFASQGSRRADAAQYPAKWACQGKEREMTRLNGFR